MTIPSLFLTLVVHLLHCDITDAVSRDASTRPEAIGVILGTPVSLDCTYNCSSGFVRGEWRWEDGPRCGTCPWLTEHRNQSEDMCTVSLHTASLTLDQTRHDYTCVSVMSDLEDLPRRIERLVWLQVRGTTTAPVVSSGDVSVRLEIQMGVQDDLIFEGLSSHSVKVASGTRLRVKCVFTDAHCEIRWTSDDENLTKARTGALLEWGEIQEEDGGRYTCYTHRRCSRRSVTVEIEVTAEGELAWIKALAGVTVFAATVVIIVLIYLSCKSRCTDLETQDSETAIYANMRTNKEGTAHKPTAQDCQSDHEVPYAEIVISVRGSSIPELTGLHSQAPRDHRLKWGEEATRGSRLQACRSADRLHVHPKEVTRKLSTTSEYAIITYSTEALT